MRPWEVAAGQRPWEVATQLYPRTITFKRPAAPTTYGIVGYQGVTEATETLLIAGVAANLEIASSGRNSSSGGLPADAAGPIKWTISLPSFVMATMPLLMERDLAYDDLGRRFQVDAYQPTPIGARIDCVRLTA